MSIFKYRGLYVFLFSLSIAFFFASGHIGGDARFIYFTAESVYTDGNLDIGDSISQKQLGPLTESFNEVVRYAQERAAAGEKVYSKFDLGSTLIGILFYGAGLLITTLMPFLPRDYALVFVFSLSNAVIISLCAFYFYKIASLFLLHERVSALIAVGFVFGTMLFPYGEKSGFGEPLACFVILMGLYYLLLYNIHKKAYLASLTGLLNGMVFITKPYAVLLLAGFVGFLILAVYSDKEIPVRQKVCHLFLYGCFFCIPIILFLIFNYARFGSILNTGYETGYFSSYSVYVSLYNLTFTLYEQLFSPGKGLFLYNPIIIAAVSGILPMYRSDKKLFVLYFGAVLPFVLFFAASEYWIGGISWGPRYLLPALGIFVLPVLFRLKEGIPFSIKNKTFRFIAAVIIAGIFIQLPAVLMNYSSFEKFFEKEEQETIYTRINFPAYSPILFGYYCMYSGIKRVITGKSAEFMLQYTDQQKIAEITAENPEVKNLTVRAVIFKSLDGYDWFDIWIVHLFKLMRIQYVVQTIAVLVIILLSISAVYCGKKILS